MILNKVILPENSMFERQKNRISAQMCIVSLNERTHMFTVRNLRFSFFHQWASWSLAVIWRNRECDAYNGFVESTSLMFDISISFVNQYELHILYFFDFVSLKWVTKISISVTDGLCPESFIIIFLILEANWKNHQFMWRHPEAKM